jgi:hypothetical protein
LSIPSRSTHPLGGSGPAGGPPPPDPSHCGHPTLAVPPPVCWACPGSIAAGWTGFHLSHPYGNVCSNRHPGAEDPPPEAPTRPAAPPDVPARPSTCDPCTPSAAPVTFSLRASRPATQSDRSAVEPLRDFCGSVGSGRSPIVLGVTAANNLRRGLRKGAGHEPDHEHDRHRGIRHGHGDRLIRRRRSPARCRGSGPPTSAVAARRTTPLSPSRQVR